MTLSLLTDPKKSLLWIFGLAGSTYSSKLKYSLGEIAQLVRSLLVSLRHLKKKNPLPAILMLRRQRSVGHLSSLAS